MKTKKLFQSGFGLAEVMVAAGIMGGLTLVLMRMNEQGQQGVSRVEKGIEASDFDREIVNFMASKSACTNTLTANKSISSFSGTSIFYITNIRNDSGQIVVSVGNKRGTVKLTRMKVHSYNSTTRTASFTKIFEFALSPGKIVSRVKTTPLSIVPNPDGTTMASCIATVSISDDVWIKDDWGIYYDDRTVAIGKRANVNTGIALDVNGDVHFGDNHTQLIVNSSTQNSILGGKLNSILNESISTSSTVPNLINSSIIGGSSNTLRRYNSAHSGESMTIVGGISNTVSSGGGFIANGFANFLDHHTGVRSAIIAGTSNSISGTITSGDLEGNNTILSGNANKITVSLTSVILGGRVNTILSTDSSSPTKNSVIAGGSGNRVTGSDSVILGGSTNSASGGATIVSGYQNTNSATNAVILGGYSNEVDSIRAVVSGFNNRGSAIDSFIAGGTSNNIDSGDSNFIGGGHNNTIAGGSIIGSAIAGGDGNKASTNYTFIGGGVSNTVSATHSFVGGGLSNTASGYKAFIGGGEFNTSSGEGSFVGGGWRNTASALNSFIAGGGFNIASGNRAFVSGTYNVGSGLHSFVGGGYENEASGDRGFVGGGEYNTTSASSSFIGGGESNSASGEKSFVGGGSVNQATGQSSFVAGGDGHNLKSASWGGFAGGGYYNTINGDSAFTVGGWWNDSLAQRAGIIGGSSNTVYGTNSTLIGGEYVTVNTSNSVVLADNSGSINFNNTNDNNRLVARFEKGYRFCSNAGCTTGVYVAASGTSWGSISDQNLKEKIQKVSGEDILKRISNLDVTSWEYKSKDKKEISYRHIGPMAQDFYKWFSKEYGLSSTETMVYDGDVRGVLLVSTKALEKRTHHLMEENKLLKSEVKNLKNDLNKIKQELNELMKNVKGNLCKQK